MAGQKSYVWFERAVPSGFEEAVSRAFEVLGPAALSPADPFSAVAQAEGIVASSLWYDEMVFSRAPNLRVLARTGIGVDTIDLEAATQRAIMVCNAPEGPTASTAEHAEMLLLMAAKRAPVAQARLREGEGDLYSRHDGLELRGKTLGLVGYGRIARRVARTARAMDMHVTAFDPYLDAYEFEGAERRADLMSLLRDADFISLHVPLSAETRGLFGDREFSAMQPGSVLINTARGGLVDHAALERALDGGLLAGAALDCTDPEPLPPAHPLLAREDVVVTPHVASATREAKEAILMTAIDQVEAALRGEIPKFLVNTEVVERLHL
jgi:D-3-phosphoglycerate dehydrogenase